MARFLKNRSKLMGKAPGTVVFIGNKKMEHSRFRLMIYNETEYKEIESDNLNQLLKAFKTNNVNWLNIDGVQDPEMIEMIGKHFDLSPLQIENIANTDQRPKTVEDNGKMVIYLKMLSFVSESNKITSEQLTLIFGDNFVISFQENVGQLFEPIRERIRTSSGKLRLSSPDYLAYRIMDTVADNYLLCLGELGELIEQNEQQILSKGNPDFAQQIYQYKTELSYVRKAIWPVKEVTKHLKNNDSDLIKPQTRIYLNALDDLIAHSVEAIEVYYIMLNDQLNIYNTNLNNRTNDVMKVLTIFSSIFIPLTFIVGVYGTNFDYLPELHYRYSYLIMWFIIILVALAMLYFFRRRRWL